MRAKIAYRRVLIKLSGEALAGSRGFGIDESVLGDVAAQIAQVCEAGVQTGIVLGGGNIFRGLAAAAAGLDRPTGDMVGMLATVMNSLLLKESLCRAGVKTRVLSAIRIDTAAEFYTVQRARSYLEGGYAVIVAGGTGNPYFTTDTAAALRCAEMKCDVLMKATKVDGIYESDPIKNPAAKKIHSLTHEEALVRNLHIMDATAFSLCRDNNIPIIVFKLSRPGSLLKCIRGKSVGSIVTKEAP